MTTQIDPQNDKVLGIYSQYYDILMLRHGDPDKERNLDQLAASLTLSHFMDRIGCQLKESVKLTETPTQVEITNYEDLKT